MAERLAAELTQVVDGLPGDAALLPRISRVACPATESRLMRVMACTTERAAPDPGWLRLAGRSCGAGTSRREVTRLLDFKLWGLARPSASVQDVPKGPGSGIRRHELNRPDTSSCGR